MTPSSAFATVLVDELVRNGVREVVLCPGSRSAPLAYAVLAAERSGRLRLHVRVDERSAGFLALGLARGAGAPVAVVTTSGTAVANLHPAVLEASHGEVPLLVVSADRPHELRGTGANQTTTQPGIFAGATRYDADLPAPVVRTGLPPFWRSTVCRAVAAATGATGGPPGPVHLNVCLREPLGPDPTAPAWPDPLDGRPRDEPWLRVVGDDGASATGLAPTGIPTVDEVARTLVVVGGTRDEGLATRAVAWAGERGHPVVAEPLGPAQVRSAALPHGPLLLTATRWLDAHAPDRVVVVGRPTLSRAVGALLRRPGLRVEVVSDGRSWPDPSHVAAVVHRPRGAVQGREPRPAGGHIARRPVGRRLARSGSPTRRMPLPHTRSRGRVASRSLGCWRPRCPTTPRSSSGRATSYGTSTSPCRAPRPPASSPTAGSPASTGWSRPPWASPSPHPGPTYALLGDLTFLHDGNGLLAGAAEPTPDLTLVVVNDDGGGIFTTLEHGAPERADDFERVFGTPTGTDLAALCRAHGIRHERVAGAASLAAAVAEPPHGIRVVEVVVDRATHRQAHADLVALAGRALSD